MLVVRVALRQNGASNTLKSVIGLDLIKSTRRAESHPLSQPLTLSPLRFYSSSSTTTITKSSTIMSTLDPVTSVLESLSIKPTAKIAHGATTSPASWKEAIAANADAPKSFELTKTLVFKPKTAKTATPVPVVVIAREETETVSGALGKKLNLKELRLAQEDILKEFFSLDKDSRTYCVFTPKRPVLI